MPRPIDANALLEHAWMMDHPDRFSEYVVSVDAIDEAPTLDVVPVRHGRWIMRYWDDESHTIKNLPYDAKLFYNLLLPSLICSECGRNALADYAEDPYASPYCPNCGCKMNLEE